MSSEIHQAIRRELERNGIRFGEMRFSRPDEEFPLVRVPAPTTLDRVRQLERRQLDLEAVCYGGLALLVFIFIISRR